MRYAVVLLTVAAGCFHPTPPEGAPCANGTDCPSPLVCDRGACVRTPVDASVIDDQEIDAPPDIAIDADLSCTCRPGGRLDCAGVVTDCTLGCKSLNPGARCIEVDPANGVGITAAEQLTIDITINGGIATFDTDTGAISGVLTRAGGQGVIADIAFEQRTIGTQGLGVWSFHRLALNGGASIHFTGVRSAVLVSGSDVTIGGVIDGSGSCYGADAACAGPGGGKGGGAAAAQGCGPGGLGVVSMTSSGNDSGGGGGGGAGAGAVGGKGNPDGVPGAGGAMCVAADAEPLVGGSGGGAGSPGAVTPCNGGGGGGALQITAAGTITVSGTIAMGGSGGEGGTPNMGTNAAAGCGGGGGGSILLEADGVTVAPGGVLAANGGGGGGGAAQTNPGNRGQPGGLSTTPAAGGGSIAGGAGGGAGAAGATPPVAGGTITGVGNAGGGGGGIGTIYVRTSAGQANLAGVSSPPAMTGALRTQ